MTASSTGEASLGRAGSGLPAALDGRVHVGTSGWAYPSWKPGFYPAKLAAKKFLEHYATRLNSVEVNYTFRQLPTAAMVASWLAATDERFRFSFRAPQRVTHFRKLRACGEIMAAFSGSLRPVVEAGRLGLVLIQLPPSFKADAALLESFLGESCGPCGSAAEGGSGEGRLRLAIEFRNAGWFTEETFAILRRHEVALCVAESDELQTPDIVTAPFTCYRLRMSGGYEAGELEAITGKLRARAAEGEVFAYFKHEEEPTGALQAEQVLRSLAGSQH
ncbi:MAG TPA: DUF72 domain-containing protein [Acidisarcina sp.]